MNNRIFIFMFLCLWAGQALAGAPAGRNTSVSISYDRLSPPARFDIWLHEPTGYDLADPQKWGRNTLTCLSRTDTTNGACMTAPVWFSANPATPYPISLRFTHSLTNQKVDVNVYGEKRMFINNKVFTFASFVTGGTGDESAWDKEPWFDFYIVKSELDKLSVPGIWSATLKQDLREWGSASCGGNFNDANVGCPGYLSIAKWQANIRIEVVDPSNQQIYLPAFPHSTPIVNLNLTYFPGKPGGHEIQGETSLDMCLYDGNNAASSRVLLRFEDDGHAAPGRANGAFSIWRRGGSKTESRDRLDYQVSVINPLIAARQTAENGVDIIWQGTNDRRVLRQVVLPGGGESVLCVPAPITLTTPAFAASSKNAGDYTGTLKIIYTPSTL
ncbi:phage tail protein [Citrobacter sp. RHB21-C05]|uniref:CfaE/CblD family pilus tip adhesin n=1 Tax=Citrobacter TaxID=544 RepID=UPI0015E94F80|nr:MULTISPECIES: CfaE/CblD family pilus tip adhesin [Citrobacter]EHG7583376.1 phage tail protein [Citrobacter sedlakii]EIQ7157690.1 phage tail protein [Citrobacter sedlakii]MBN6596959.1 phage tail protein [Citrobacter sedlakii]QMK46565.1 phage tail protein [Citrobacter sp. RHB21-C05]QMK65008.1 phage tail protein [Citrobacter sp. RHB21-C01]